MLHAMGEDGDSMEYCELCQNLVEVNFWEYPAKWGYDICVILTS